MIYRFNPEGLSFVLSIDIDKNGKSSKKHWVFLG